MAGFEWLLQPIDTTRIHYVGGELSWHARLMFVAWNVLIPLGIIWARFLKVTPKQQWPQTLDNKTWWRGHVMLQYSGVFLMMPALWFVWDYGALPDQLGFHGQLGWSLVLFAMLQITSGLLRGSKGGPTDTTMKGAHYDMTMRRVIFEYVHKNLGYLALFTAFSAVLTGLWQSNAPVWIWLVVFLWWSSLSLLFLSLQKLGFAFDTYQAIWGPNPLLPGNKRKPIGFPGLRVKKYDFRDYDHYLSWSENKKSPTFEVGEQQKRGCSEAS